jgi:hypothetical protein
MRWTEKDFSEISWHDCHINSLAFEQDGEWQSDLVFNLDFIVEWLCQTGSKLCRFRVAPATLRFHDACNLRIQVKLAFKEPLIIYGIERTHTADCNQGYSHWTMTLQSFEATGSNLIEFNASGFTQELIAEPVETSEQDLSEFRRRRSSTL